MNSTYWTRRIISRLRLCGINMVCLTLQPKDVTTHAILGKAFVGTFQLQELVSLGSLEMHLPLRCLIMLGASMLPIAFKPSFISVCDFILDLTISFFMSRQAWNQDKIPSTCGLEFLQALLCFQLSPKNAYKLLAKGRVMGASMREVERRSRCCTLPWLKPLVGTWKLLHFCLLISSSLAR